MAISKTDGVNLGQAQAIGGTEKALRVQLESENEPRWIPRSQIHDDSEVYDTGTDGDLVVTRWFAEKEGLEACE
jgi:hypothetical protein